MAPQLQLRRDRRPAQDLRPGGHGKPLAARLGEQRRLPPGSSGPRRALQRGDSAAERHRQPAHGPRLQHGLDRHDRAAALGFPGPGLLQKGFAA